MAMLRTFDEFLIRSDNLKMREDFEFDGERWTSYLDPWADELSDDDADTDGAVPQS